MFQCEYKTLFYSLLFTFFLFVRITFLHTFLLQFFECNNITEQNLHDNNHKFLN